MSKPRILIIDDNKKFVDDLLLLLRQEYNCRGVHSAERGLEILEEEDFDLVLLDIDLGPGMDGFQFLSQIKELDILIPVIMITKDRSIGTVVKAMKMGAYDYVGKKPDLSELRIIVNRALNEVGLRRENKLLREEVQSLTGELLGESNAILNIKEQVVKFAETNSTVLITGESGTGKGLIARQIHSNSLRKDKPFVVVNCAAIPKELFESELFGHEKGAFTGAYRKKLGKFELANHGTIFLDEIGDLDNSLQAKFLRVLEEKKFERVGGEKSVSVDVRVLVATNKDLEVLTKRGNFREDLYYRLNVVRIHIPPLRERKEDIPILAKEFTRRKGRELKKTVKGISKEALNILISYDWPGNVRELENLIENAIISTEKDILTPDMFPSLSSDYAISPNYETAKKNALERFQREYVSTILRLTDGNITQAAQRMGISRQGLQKLIRNLNIHLPKR